MIGRRRGEIFDQDDEVGDHFFVTAVDPIDDVEPAARPHALLAHPGAEAGEVAGAELPGQQTPSRLQFKMPRRPQPCGRQVVATLVANQAVTASLVFSLPFAEWKPLGAAEKRALGEFQVTQLEDGASVCEGAGLISKYGNP